MNKEKLHLIAADFCLITRRIVQGRANGIDRHYFDEIVNGLPAEEKCRDYNTDIDFYITQEYQIFIDRFRGFKNKYPKIVKQFFRVFGVRPPLNLQDELSTARILRLIEK